MSSVINDHNELMLNCLKMEEFDKTRAIRLYIAQFPEHQKDYAQRYAYKVYDRVLKGLTTTDEARRVYNKMLLNLEKASDYTLRRGIEDHEWGPFAEITKLQQKLFGVDKQQSAPLVQITQQTAHIGDNRDEVLQRVEHLQSKLGLGGSAGVRTVPSAPPSGNHTQSAPFIQAQP